MSMNIDLKIFLNQLIYLTNLYVYMNVFASCPNIYFTQRVNRNFYLQKLQPTNKV